MDLLSLRLFLRVAALGGLSAAARDLSMSPASASARLAKLEDTLGIRLFNRTTRAVTLTPDGAQLLPYAQQSLETLDNGLGVVRGEGRQAKGVLRMTLPGSFGRMHVIPLLAAFQAEHPLIHLDLRLSDEILDLVEGAYDLAVRNAPLSDSSLFARKLVSDRRLLVASPSYLERHGAPSSPSDLSEHCCLVLGDHRRWKFESGQVVTVPTCHRVNDGEALRAMVEVGMGIGIASVWNAHESMKSGCLVDIMPDHPLLTESAIWALYSGNRLVPAKVRAMIDFLVQAYQPVPPWEKL